MGEFVSGGGLQHRLQRAALPLRRGVGGVHDLGVPIGIPGHCCCKLWRVRRQLRQLTAEGGETATGAAMEAGNAILIIDTNAYSV